MGRKIYPDRFGILLDDSGDILTIISLGDFGSIAKRAEAVEKIGSCSMTNHS
jgi:hypothetical protein